MQVPQPRRPRNSLSETVILDAAETLLRSGVTSLTIRHISHELQCSNMALYRYFGTKEILESALLDRILSKLDLAERPQQEWRSALVELAIRHRQLIEENRWAIPLFFRNPLPGPAAVRIGESALQILARGGVEGESAVTVFVSILAMNYGWAGFASMKNDAFIAGQTQYTLEQTLQTMSQDSFPLTNSVTAYFAAYGSDTQYRKALSLLLASIGTADVTSD